MAESVVVLLAGRVPVPRFLRDHRTIALATSDKSREQIRTRLRPGGLLPSAGHDLLGQLPGLRIDQRLMIAFRQFLARDYVTGIDRIGQHLPDLGLMPLSRTGLRRLSPDALTVQDTSDLHRSPFVLGEPSKDALDYLSLLWDRFDCAAHDVLVAVWWIPLRAVPPARLRPSQ